MSVTCPHLKMNPGGGFNGETCTYSPNNTSWGPIELHWSKSLYKKQQYSYQIQLLYYSNHNPTGYEMYGYTFTAHTRSISTLAYSLFIPVNAFQGHSGTHANINIIIIIITDQWSRRNTKQEGESQVQPPSNTTALAELRGSTIHKF